MTKRRVLKPALFLLLGAIVNVAVAWGCGLAQSGQSTNAALSADHLAWWRANAPPGIRSNPVALRETRSFGRQLDMISEWTETSAKGFVDCEHLWRQRSGWPCQSMEYATWVAPPTLIRQRTLVIPKQWPLGGSSLGLRPIWPGFAINTVFYAVVLWLLFAGPFVVRRWRRIRRGLCPKCAYDLRGAGSEASVCPECGASK